MDTEQKEEDKGFRFLLKRTDESQESWNAILGGSPKLGNQGINVDVSLGCENQLPIEGAAKKEDNQIIIFLHNYLTGTFLVISLIVLAIFFFKREEFLKENTKRNQGTFSLARTQMAWWFFIILGSFLYTYVRTGDLTNTINSQAWILLGISATTGLSAILIDDRDKKKHSK